MNHKVPQSRFPKTSPTDGEGSGKTKAGLSTQVACVARLIRKQVTQSCSSKAARSLLS